MPLSHRALTAVLALAIPLAPAQPKAEPPPRQVVQGDLEEAGWSKEDKALWLNLGAGAAVVGWGVASWDWGGGGPTFQDEGWLGSDTSEGGADKLGHMWSGYALSHLFAWQYDRWGFDNEASARLGALSSFGLMGLVEVGDSLSDEYGFSVQDALFSTAGAALGYVLWREPALSSKLDFRIEYDPFREGEHEADIFTDYDRLRYLLALKGEGFEALSDSPARFLELHLGFYARNYDDYNPSQGTPDLREQHVYVGIGLNIAKLLEPYCCGAPFRYIQVPYTYLPLDWRVD
jgi:uncharacterized protein YfiM (DUF2279 family)